MDDMLVKSRKAELHLNNLKETFDTLRKYQMRLNPTKCVFGVSSGNFLGFVVSQRGVEANPEKVKAILDMTSPRSVKEVQRLTGCIAALNRFVSRAIYKCLLFFKTLKQALQWTDECEEPFQALKDYLSKPLLLSPSIEGEDLFLYLAVSQTAVSSTLIREELKIQKPIYYTSQAFQGAEARYPKIEKLALALIVASRKLHFYFQAHTILVMMDQPLRKAMDRLDAIGRMVQWVVELSQFDVDYRPRTTIKAQALVDFVAEFTMVDQDPESDYWTVYTDGSSASGMGGVGVILLSLEKYILKYKVQLQFLATNNEAKYEAILTGLRVAKALGVRNLKLNSNLKLVTGQMNNKYEAKEDRMKRYLALTSQLISNFDDVKITQVPWEENLEVDEVARLASLETNEQRPRLYIEVQYLPSIEGFDVNYV